MHNLCVLYGKYIVVFCAILLLAAGCFCLFWNGWCCYGIAADGGKTGTVNHAMREDAPVIDARSCRVAQGEKTELGSLAAARDGDGSDLTGGLVFLDAEDREITGVLDTNSPGVYPITIIARSRSSGRESRKKIVVLVDGRVDK